MKTISTVTAIVLLSLLFLHTAVHAAISPFPVVINTWPFTQATEAAYSALLAGSSHVDAAVVGCSRCEDLQCDGSVGWGGSPDETGETTLDALVIDGETMDMGAVADLRRVKNAVGVARAVLYHTDHTLLAGDQATQFAAENGFKVENLTSPTSEKIWSDWKANNCQPNYRKNVSPDASTSCGPYTPLEITDSFMPNSDSFPRVEMGSQVQSQDPKARSHDTIAMAVIDQYGRIAAATSTNGATHKIPGRVGDSPIPGSGAYAEKENGACGGTGDGDIHMRFGVCLRVVLNMKNGMTPTAAAEDGIRTMLRYYPSFQGALWALNMKGEHGGACTGWNFSYSYRNSTMSTTQVFNVQPIS